MTNKKQQLRAEIEYLYAALHRIMVISRSNFDSAYEVALAACDAYESNRKIEKENIETRGKEYKTSTDSL